MSDGITNTVYVDVYKSKLPWKGRPWRWKAKSSENQERMAQGQAYLREGDAIHAVQILFGDATNAYLRRREQGNVPLRLSNEA